MPWSWRDDSMAWNGLWWVSTIWESNSASFDGSSFGRSMVVGRTASFSVEEKWQWLWLS